MICLIRYYVKVNYNTFYSENNADHIHQSLKAEKKNEVQRI